MSKLYFVPTENPYVDAPWPGERTAYTPSNNRRETLYSYLGWLGVVALIVVIWIIAARFTSANEEAPSVSTVGVSTSETKTDTYLTSSIPTPAVRSSEYDTRDSRQLLKTEEPR